MISLKIANNQDQQLNSIRSNSMSINNKSSNLQHLEIAGILPRLDAHILVF